MVNFPNEQELEELRAFGEPFCLTVYVPFTSPGSADNPNRIELKNLLRQAETALLSTGAKPDDIQKTLRPARRLLANHEFWPVNYASLVLFMHPKLFRYYHLPDRAIPYMLTVEKGFNLGPLVKVMRANKRYFVLALNHNNVRLYEGDHYHLKPVRLKNFPANLKATLGIDEYPKWMETHRVAPASSGKGSEAFHGQYNVSQTDKAMLLEFFRRIDRRLHPLLYRRHYPLIIAGVNYLLPIYRRVNTYPDLLLEGISGSLERTGTDGIRDKAWRLLGSGG
jgi:hypothetical protein